MPNTTCVSKPTTKWWGYLIVIILFLLGLLMAYGLVRAEKRVFTYSVRAYATELRTLPKEKSSTKKVITPIAFRGGKVSP